MTCTDMILAQSYRTVGTLVPLAADMDRGIDLKSLLVRHQRWTCYIEVAMGTMRRAYGMMMLQLVLERE